jgi:ADP-ribosyl-[dinitrogen reductase] hydrolase
MKKVTLNRAQGCLLGLAIGDAVGTTVEFSPRGSFEPVIDLVGGGPFQLAAGQWTDDTSMALCLAASLAELQTFDANDQMRRYVRWYRDGYYSSTGRCFDIGITTQKALAGFEKSGDPFSGSSDIHSAGNGCLMRLAPVPIFFADDIEKAMDFSAESSKVTHKAAECIDASRLFGGMLVKALNGISKEAILLNNDLEKISSTSIQEIGKGSYLSKSDLEIKGSGYVVKSLEAALWCFYQSNSYKEAVLLATNLGDDADTTAAICGQIAGAYYGREGIPTAWQEKVYMRDEILGLVNSLHHHTIHQAR